MLKKTQVLPIGSIVAVMFPSGNGEETIAVIIGHLTLKKDRQCFYDYACVEYPSGIENGVFYINEPDITRVISKAEDYEQKHKKWMERKYAEYTVYYSQYRSDLRPDIDKMRKMASGAEDTLHPIKRIHVIKRWICALLILIGAVLTAFATKSWEAVTGALFFAFIGWLSVK